jgi:hypothetical protein
LVSTSIDHMVSLVLFLAVILIFTGLFNQTIQTAVIYQQHSALSTKNSDLLDYMLLSPDKWSAKNITSTLTSFGLQDQDLSQYQLSPFSLMRLESATTPVQYEMDGQNKTYSSITMGFGQYILVQYSEVMNYSYASKLLGVNGSYSFVLTISPTVNVAISRSQSTPMLSFSLNVTGPGLPLAGAIVNYCLVTVTGRNAPNKPLYNIYSGTTSTNAAGLANVTFSGVDVTQKSYALIASASLSGVSGVGYYSNSLCNSTYIVPLISNFENHKINLAHSWGILNASGGHSGDPGDLCYNATFLRAGDMTEMLLNNGTGQAGELNAQQLPPHTYDNVTLDSNSLGVLVVPYSLNSSASGIVVMPWGFSSLGFSVSFGAQPDRQEWISTDMRQVLVNSVPYQAKLSLGSYAGHQVIT